MDFGKDPEAARSRSGKEAQRIEREFKRFGFLVYRIGHGILKNREEAEDLVLDRLRTRKQDREVAWDEDSLRAPDDEGAIPALDCARLIRVLNAVDQDILRRKYGEGLAWEEIGTTLGLSVPQVRYRSAKALDLLRRLGNRKGDGHARG